MSTLPFKTYNEAVAYFGVKIPARFFNSLSTIDAFCQKTGTGTLDTLFDLFGILRVDDKEARYQQTPIELFPFASTGGDGIHYGFVIHTADEEDYPSGELCPMDTDGVVNIANNSKSLFQNLLCDEESIKSFLPLLKELQLEPIVTDRVRYDDSDNPLRVSIQPKPGWKFVDTTDGTGVLAERKYFADYHEKKHDHLNQDKLIEHYQSSANDMFKKGLHASQLYYLKELYWDYWPNYELAKDLLRQMLQSYESLNREHLFNTTKWVLDTFDKRYIG